MRCHYILLSILLILSFVPAAYARSPISGFNPASLITRTDDLFLDSDAFLGNNALPLPAIFFGRWEGKSTPDDQNILDIYWKTDTGVVYHGWRYAGFYRGELFMEANRDTVELIRMVNLRQTLSPDRQFDIEIEGKGFSAKGVELSKGIFANILRGLSAGLTLRYMAGERIQDGKIEGTAVATGERTYDFDLHLDYVYDKNLIYERMNTDSGRGNGYSLDLGLRYLLSERLSADLLLRDIMGRIYWRDVPYTIADAGSEIIDLDEQGYQIYRPTINGFEGYRDFMQKLPLKTDLILSYRNGSFALTSTTNFIGKRPLYWIDLDYITRKEISINVGYNTNYQTFSLGTAYRNVLIRIYLSDADLSDINVIGLTLSLYYNL